MYISSRGNKIEARAQTGLPHVGCKCAFALFVFKLDERGWHSVPTGNMGDGAVWGSVWEHPGVYGSSVGVYGSYYDELHGRIKPAASMLA